MPGWKVPYHFDLTNTTGLVWRNNTGGATYKGKHKDYHVKFGVAGMPDIIGLTNAGRFIGCEVKVPGKDLAELQAWMRDNLLAMGAVVFKATSYDECLDALKKNGL